MATSNCSAKALAGTLRDCSTSQGGIKTVYIATYDSVDGKPTLDEGGQKISTIKMKEGTPETNKFYKYNFRKGTGSMSSALTVDQANGVNYVTTTLNLSFLRMQTTLRVEMEALSVNELAVIVRDSNDKLWYLGYDEAVTASSGAGETGQAKTDGNKYSITLTDDSNSWPYEVDPTALTSIVNEI